jgi:hypothetical protein
LLFFVRYYKIIEMLLKFFSSSVVERSAVNRHVVGSSPTWGDVKNFIKLKFLTIYKNSYIIYSFLEKKLVGYN